MAKRLTEKFNAALLIVVVSLAFAILPESKCAEHSAQNAVAGKRLEQLKLIRVPLVRQATEYTCGPAAVESVARYFGVEYDESKLAAALNTNSKVGTFYADIIAWGRKKGFKVDQHQDMTLADLEKRLDAFMPVICLIQAWPDKPVEFKTDFKDGHYVVACGYDQDNVYFMDPWTLGNYTYIPKDEFLNRWHDRQRGLQIVHLGIILSRPRSAYDDQIIKKVQ